MRDGFVKVAAGTPAIEVGDVARNADAIVGMAQKAYRLGVKILVFPELCVTGYTCGDLFMQDALLDAAESAIRDILDRTCRMDMLMAVGVPVRANGKLYNCAAVMHMGELLGLEAKRELPNYGEFYEARWFTRGCADTAITFSGRDVVLGFGHVYMCEAMPELCVGVEICEDLWAVSPMSEELARRGATIILNLSASNELVGKAQFRRELITAQSARLLAGYVYAGAGDGESTTDLVFAGPRVVAENGQILGEDRFSTGLTFSDIDVARLSYERRRLTDFPEYADVNCVYTFPMEIAEDRLTREFSPLPFVPANSAERDERCREVFDMQTLGLMKRLEHTGARRLVIGVSGGLDSTLALLVCARVAELAGNGSSVIAVTMPCFGTTGRTRTNAERLAEYLGAELRVIDISGTVRSHFDDIGHDWSNQNAAFENAQARERTQVVMDIANDVNGLAVGTGDLSELALGWTTYNGDHMSMYGVNAGVPKTLVRYVVNWYADTCGDEDLADVLRDILDTPVSPELLPPSDGQISQRTEDIVGPYELHDFFLYYFQRLGFPPEKILRLARRAFREYDSDDILMWLRTFTDRFFSQQFKRSCLPDGPKVGTVSLSPRGDWRMPSDASAAVWLGRLNEQENRHE